MALFCKPLTFAPRLCAGPRAVGLAGSWLQQRCQLINPAQGALAFSTTAPAATQTNSTTAPAATQKKKAPRLVDPDAPKRPATAFLLFITEFAKTQPAIKGADRMRKAGAEWKTLTPQRKQPFLEAFEKEQAIYHKKRDEYVSSGKKDAFKRDPLKPKLPKSGFLRFMDDFRPSLPKDSKVSEVGKRGGEAWKKLPEEKKRPYNELYEKEKVKYDKAIALYKESGKQAAWETRVGITAVKAKEAEKLAQEKAKKAEAQAKAKAVVERKKMMAAKKKAADMAKKARDAAKAKADAAKAKADAAKERATEMAKVAKAKEALNAAMAAAKKKKAPAVAKAKAKA
eukprot:CAMPEP_0195053314 /NCGR_PEP_ID=MMETSP0448-20130528/2493_1 /TAXON_ID=66468 /ORGANISM="Heterocapsa triquestra, Strain CCMP 448" /LENGTH=340 /DNA_ID=CAMNT_0040082593 /DNA_START=74 /DNA_END=1096 /DNA_ORIENTATION=-